MTASSEASPFSIEERIAFRPFEAARLPGFDEMRAASLSVHARRRRWAWLRANKAYLRPVLHPVDLRANPVIVEYALHVPLLEAAAAYLGEWPRLRSVQLFWTRANRTTGGSQRFHRDHVGERQLKAFVYLNDVAEPNGPISLLPAEASERVLVHAQRATGRFDDAEIAAAGADEAIFPLLGPAGAGLLADTTRCFHFGGRTREGERLMLMLQYVRERDEAPGRGVLRPVHPDPGRLGAKQRRSLEREGRSG